VSRDQSRPISAIDRSSPLATASLSPLQLRHPSLEFAARCEPLPVGTMMSQDGGVERDSAISLAGGQPKTCVTDCRWQAVLGRGSLADCTPEPAPRRSTNFSVTPHSIDDILRRPHAHVTSLLLPASRRTCGAAATTHDGVCAWSTESAEGAERRRTGGDEELQAWKTRYWTQPSPGPSTKRGL